VPHTYVSMTNTFNEADHPRDNGAFTDKPQTAPAVTLSAPRKVGSLGGYEIKAYKSHGAGREGGGFTANIYRDGKKVLVVSNTGNGGPNDYEDAATGRRHSGKELEGFQAMALKAFPDKPFEAEDGFVEFVKWHGDIDKSIAKNDWPRDEVVEENIAASDKRSFFKITDREREILLDPDILTRE
jgi:hypothetical protein